MHGAERQAEIIGRLEQLESDGHIEGFNVHVWGDAVATETALSDTDTGRGVRNLVAAFEQWALSENVSVQSFFERTEKSSALSGEKQAVITLPSIAVAEYDGHELVGMAPHETDDGTLSVREYLEAAEKRLERSLVEEANAASRLAVPGGD